MTGRRKSTKAPSEKAPALSRKEKRAQNVAEAAALAHPDPFVHAQSFTLLSDGLPNMSFDVPGQLGEPELQYPTLYYAPPGPPPSDFELAQYNKENYFTSLCPMSVIPPPAPSFSPGLPFLPEATSSFLSAPTTSAPSSSSFQPHTPFLPEATSSFLSAPTTSAPNPSSASLRADSQTMRDLRKHLYTNTAQISGATGDVIVEHQAKRRGKMPDPSKLLSQSVRAASVTAPSISDRSHLSMESEPRFSPYHPRIKTSRTLSSSDRPNVANTGNDFVSRLCISDCWMAASPERTDRAREALISANLLAQSKGRPPTMETNSILQAIAHFGGGWRSQVKLKTPNLLRLWDVFPPAKPKLSSVDERLFIKSRVAALLHNNSFLHSGYECRPYEIVGKHTGELLLFNNLAFLQYVDKVIYDESGIARKHETNFVQQFFPLPALCMLAATVKGVLEDHANGIHFTTGKRSYEPHYTVFLTLATGLMRSAYHRALLSEIREGITETGKMSLRTTAGSLIQDSYNSIEGIPDYVNLDISDAEDFFSVPGPSHYQP